MEEFPEQPIAESSEPAPVVAPSTEPPHEHPSTVRHIFMGRFGLRAGWGIAIFVIVAFLLIVAGNFAALGASGHLREALADRAQVKAHPNAPRPHLDVPFTPALVFPNDALPFLGMVAMCWVFSKAERRRFGTYGIGSKRLSDFLPGAFWGLAALSLLVFVLHSLHLLVFDARILFGPAIFLYGLKWLLCFLFVGFSEEYQLRGYLQYTLTRGVYGLAENISPERARLVAFWIAAVIMSCVFGLLHLNNPGENGLGILQVVLVGLVFSYALWRTGSLWWGIGFHMAWDWAQSFLYGVADSGYTAVGRLFQTHPTGKPLLSGGVDGPEGSILCCAVMLLLVVVIRFTTTPGIQPPLEQVPKLIDVPPDTQPAIA